MPTTVNIIPLLKYSNSKKHQWCLPGEGISLYWIYSRLKVNTKLYPTEKDISKALFLICNGKILNPFDHKPIKKNITIEYFYSNFKTCEYVFNEGCSPSIFTSGFNLWDIKKIMNLNANRNGNYLDIGCGSANNVKSCSKGIAFGITLPNFRIDNGKYFNFLRFPDNIKFGDVHQIDKYFASEKFNLITSTMAFRHFAHPVEVLKKTYSLLKIGGFLYVDFITLKGLSTIEICLVCREIKKECPDSEIFLDFIPGTFGFKCKIKKHPRLELKLDCLKFDPDKLSYTYKLKSLNHKLLSPKIFPILT